MAVEGIVMQRADVQNKMSAPRRINISRHRDFAAKLIGLVGFPFADAFRFRRMPWINFFFVVTLLFFYDQCFWPV